MSTAAKLESFGSGAKGAVIGVAAVAAIALVAYVIYKGPAKAGAGVGKGVGEAVGGAVGGAAVGTVYGVSDAIGIPRTDQDKCSQAIAAGSKWDASLYCPASRFLSWMFGGSGDASSTSAPDPTQKLINDQQPNVGLETGG